MHRLRFVYCVELNFSYILQFRSELAQSIPALEPLQAAPSASSTALVPYLETSTRILCVQYSTRSVSRISRFGPLLGFYWLGHCLCPDLWCCHQSFRLHRCRWVSLSYKQRRGSSLTIWSVASLELAQLTSLSAASPVRSSYPPSLTTSSLRAPL